MFRARDKRLNRDVAVKVLPCKSRNAPPPLMAGASFILISSPTPPSSPQMAR